MSMNRKAMNPTIQNSLSPDQAATFLALSPDEQELVESLIVKEYSDSVAFHLSLPSVTIFLKKPSIDPSIENVLIQIFNICFMPKANLQVKLIIENASIKFGRLTLNTTIHHHSLRASFEQSKKESGNTIISVIPSNFRDLLETENQLTINRWLPDYQEAIRQEIVQMAEKRNGAKIKSFIRLFTELYSVTNHTDETDDLLALFICFLIHTKNLTSHSQEMTPLPWKEVLLNYDNDYLFLHKAFITNDMNEIETVFNLVQNTYSKVDDKNNTFLHLCSSGSNVLQRALNLTPDLNYQNNDGNTALHLAAKYGDLEKAAFLMLRGADPSIVNREGKTFWTIEGILPNLSLDVYRKFKSEGGKVIDIPLLPVDQHGPACGMYAIAFIAYYYYIKYPHLFNAAPLPARKSDHEPAASYSLREYFKKSCTDDNKKKSEVGELLSIDYILEGLQLLGCNGRIHEIQDFLDFTSTIEKGLDHSPLIIPFSTNGDALPAEIPDPKRIHWATIWGYNSATNELLLAQYNHFFIVDGRKIFTSSFDLPEATPDLFFIKNDHYWERVDDPLSLPAENMCHLKPASLAKFRRHLLTTSFSAAVNDSCLNDTTLERSTKMRRVA